MFSLSPSPYQQLDVVNRWLWLTDRRYGVKKQRLQNLLTNSQQVCVGCV